MRPWPPRAPPLTCRHVHVPLRQLSLGGGIVLVAALLAAFDAVASAAARRHRPALMLLLAAGYVGWFVGVTQLVALVPYQQTESWAPRGPWASRVASTFYAIPTALMHALTCAFGLSSVSAGATVLQAHVPALRGLLRTLHRTRDYLLSTALCVPLLGLSLLGLPHYLQTRLVFQQSSFFFSETPRGRAWCAASASAFCLLIVAWLLYVAGWFLGYLPAPPLGVFQC